MIDIVLPLGKGSQHNNIELRYCLRSIEKHAKNVGKIYIVGDKPHWTINVEHVKQKDVQGKEYSILLKYLKTVKLQELSDNFMSFNDDFFLLQDVDFNTFENKVRNISLEERPVSVSSFYRQVIYTTNILKSLGLPLIQYDGHFPMKLNKEKFLKWHEFFTPYISYRNCVLPKASYGSLFHTEESNPEPIADLKLCYALIEEEIKDKINNKPWFSLGDKALNKSMFKILEDLYPTPSKYEK